ncbi:MAG TPA: hypothetical protein DCE08_07900 [Ruminococcaceae bacterium]|nr:hypothetical protein [Oscillospiraceae bacterium]
MDELKNIVASNLIELRVASGMTQSQLAEKINYSDKSVSKWERAEAIPDVAVLKNIADVFGVTVDYLITTHDRWEKKPKKEKRIVSRRMIIAVSVMGIWAAAFVAFVILWLMERVVWQIFLGAVPVSLITLLVLHSVFGHGKYNFWIVTALMLSVLSFVYFLFLRYNWWQIFLLAVPLELVIFFGFRICRPKPKQP